MDFGKELWGWISAGAVAIWNTFTKVDAGRLHEEIREMRQEAREANERLEGKVDALDAKVDVLSIDVAVLKASRNGNGREYPKPAEAAPIARVNLKE